MSTVIALLFKRPLLAFTGALLALSYPTVVVAKDEHIAELEAMARECASARHNCYRPCMTSVKMLKHEREAQPYIQNCQKSYALFKGSYVEEPKEPQWTPDYANMPDVTGIYLGHGRVRADGRNDWNQYCRRFAFIGEEKIVPTNIPRLTNVKVVGIRYVTNPRPNKQKSKMLAGVGNHDNACLADRIETR